MIRNTNRDTIIAERPWLADSMLWRMRGMLGRRFEDFDAMVFERCGSIHMWFMHMPLDIVFLDREHVVVGLRPNLRPWRMASEWSAATTVELPVGAIAASHTALGDHLDLGHPLRNGKA